MLSDPEITTGFEGAEKILHIKIESTKPNGGLRQIPQDIWQYVLNTANCQIMSRCESDNCTAFVLSESSLFIFDNKCIFKTCGRTTLLLVIPAIKEMLQNRCLELEYLLFSSKNYLFPEEQVYPHTTWKDAENYLRSFFPSENSVVLGNSEGDSVFLFTYSKLLSPIPEPDISIMKPPKISDWIPVMTDVSYLVDNGQSSQAICTPSDSSDHDSDFDPGDNSLLIPRFITPNSPVAKDQRVFCEGGIDECIMNLMMYNMDEEVSTMFFNVDRSKVASEVTRSADFGSFYPQAVVDDVLFDPCGYSMNGLALGGFYTIHVTPEANCSYASFETSVPCSDHIALVERVLSILRPKRFTMTFFYNNDMVAYETKSPIGNEVFVIEKTNDTYCRTDCSIVKKEGCIYSMGNFLLK